jgi:hypothetical protein
MVDYDRDIGGGVTLRIPGLWPTGRVLDESRKVYL